MDYVFIENPDNSKNDSMLIIPVNKIDFIKFEEIGESGFETVLYIQAGNKLHGIHYETFDECYAEFQGIKEKIKKL